MKFLLLLALVGFASAGLVVPSVHDDACAKIQYAKSLATVNRDAAIQTLQETLDQLLQEVKDKLDHGFEVGNKLLDKVEEVANLLKKMGAEMGVKAKELFNKIKESYKNFFYNAFKNLFGWGKLPETHRGWFDWLEKYKETLKNLLQMINDQIDVEKIKQYIKDKIGDNFLGNILLDQLTEGVGRLKELINKFIDLLEGRSPRGLFDLLEDILSQIKELLNRFKEALFNNFGAFSEWAKDKWNEAMENAQTMGDRAKLLALAFIEHANTMNQETKDLALEFFSMYKEELGNLYYEIEAIIKGNKAAEIDYRGFLDKYKEQLKNLLQMINDNIDVDKIKQYIVDKFGGENSLIGGILLDHLTGGLNRLKELLTKLIDYLEGRSARGWWDDLMEQIKELVDKFQDALFSQFGDFSEWVKKIWNKGLEEAKTIEEKVKLIAQAFIESGSGLSEETKQLALKFFSMYKKELGDLYYEIEKIVKG